MVQKAGLTRVLWCVKHATIIWEQIQKAMAEKITNYKAVLLGPLAEILDFDVHDRVDRPPSGYSDWI